MLVHQIKEFITQLSAPSLALKPYDRDFLTKLDGYFADKLNDAVLSADDLQFLKRFLALRWPLVQDSSQDYTINIGGASGVWIALAKELAPLLAKNYVQLLIPVMSNTVDPLNFSKISDCSDIRSLYLGHDNKTMYRVRALFQHAGSERSFSTFDDIKNVRPRPLSLTEMLRIRRKVEDGLSFVLDSVSYRGYWDHLKRALLPTWQSKGEVPLHLLSSLLNIAVIGSQTVWDEIASRTLRQALQQLSLSLMEGRIDDVNFLYAQAIKVGSDSFLLLEILLDCFYNDFSLRHEKMIAIATWLTTVDPSLVSSADHLSPLYESLHLGKGLRPDDVRTTLQTLKPMSSLAISALIEPIIRKLTKEKSLSASTVNSVKALYKARWRELKDSPNDYLRQQSAADNTLWIKLAQSLVGGGFVPNAYALLIPSLTQFEELISGDNITSYPLSHFILSDDGSQLILLDNSVARFREYRTFYNCNSHPAKPFTEKEQARLPFAAQRFHEYIEKMRSRGDEPPIRITTLQAVKSLVEGSLYPQGLLYGHDYNATQMGSALNAYITFSQFYHRLPDDERVRLNRQRILFHGREMRFEEVIERVQNDECIATYGQYLAQLVMDYAPYWFFHQELEARAHINEMRDNSRQKVCRDYEDVNEEEALRRLQVIAVSLLTHGFHYLPLTGLSIQLWDCRNNTIDSGREIFELIKPILVDGHSREARFVLAKIKYVLAEALKDKSWGTFFSRYDNSIRWMQSIVSDEMFARANVCYPAKHLVTRLINLCQRNVKIRTDIYPLLDDMINTFSQAQSASMVNLRCNVKLHKYLAMINPNTRVLIQQMLHAPVAALASQTQFWQSIVDYMKLRMNDTLANFTQADPRFFTKNRSSTRLTDAFRGIIPEPGLDDAQALQSLLADFCRSIDKLNLPERCKFSLNQHLHVLSAPIAGHIPVVENPASAMHSL